MSRETFSYFIGSVVAVMWAISVGVQALTRGAVEAPHYVHGVMFVVVSALFGAPALRRKNGEPRD